MVRQCWGAYPSYNEGSIKHKATAGLIEGLGVRLELTQDELDGLASVEELAEPNLYQFHLMGDLSPVHSDGICICQICGKCEVSFLFMVST